MGLRLQQNLGGNFRSAISARPQLSSCRSFADLRIVNVDLNPQTMLSAFRITWRSSAFPVSYDMMAGRPSVRPSACGNVSAALLVLHIYWNCATDVPVENV